jgi:Host cell surface-exposed lipoprotein
MLKKVLKWGLVAVVGLIILGALVGNDDKSSGQAAKSGGSEQVVTQTTPETTPEATPSPTPTPEPVNVSFDGPNTTTSDAITLKGKINLKGAKVKVDGAPAAVKGRKWSLSASIKHKGDNLYRVVASKAGHGRDRTVASVTRKLSAAEKAVIRQQKAERRANRRALQSAESYLAMSGFSKQGLYEQLSSPAGEGFTQAEAQYAVDHVHADWNKEAVESARSYLEMSPMSRADLIQQLSSSAGEGFTYEQALYAVNKVY